jgi:hypothetical protein
MWRVPRDWEGEHVFVVAGGPTLDGLDLSVLRGRPAIAVNRSWESARHARYCFGMDPWFFTEYRPWEHGFAGTCVCITPVPDCPVMRLGSSDLPGLSADAGKVVCSRTSLQGAINVAVLAGAARLTLIAADGKNDAAAAKAHKARYPAKAHRPARYDDWRGRMEGVAAALERLGIPVVNVSFDSAYADLWPTVGTIGEALCRQGEISNGGTGAPTCGSGTAAA